MVVHIHSTHTHTKKDKNQQKPSKTLQQNSWVDLGGSYHGVILRLFFLVFSLQVFSSSLGCLMGE